jgi:23S rRNA pseudouridine2604 synthase
LTDDPGLVNSYEHPKNGIEKEYDIELDKDLAPRDRIQAIQGVKDGEDMLKALKIIQIKRYHFRVLLNEGKKRHIRRLFQVL